MLMRLSEIRKSPVNGTSKWTISRVNKQLLKLQSYEKIKTKKEDYPS